MKIITGAAFKQDTGQTQAAQTEEVDKTVLAIIQDVQRNGDAALKKYAATFDKAVLDSLLVSNEEWEGADRIVSDDFLQAIDVAQKQITNFHEEQLEESWQIEPREGVTLGQQLTPMDRVGVYIPGGKAAYPSTVLMNVIPAKLAGVKDIVIATPPQPDGGVNPYVLAAAKIAGATSIFKMGGAQAIAALAYGTESVPKTDKIVGPGNAYVARAKKWVYGDVAIDMIAGPSEICVVADDTAPASFVAADLLSQAEHDEAATSICITFSEEAAKAIQMEVTAQLQDLPRKAIAEASIRDQGRIITVNSLDEAFELVNHIAPEHLQLMIRNATDQLHKVRHAGAIFLGNYAPEPLGDYVAGPNHTLPTNGTARFASPLGVYDFMKKSSIIQYTEAAFVKEAEAIETIAKVEGLEAHARSIAIRRKKG